jgi:HSF-type DNA-binding
MEDTYINRKNVTTPSAFLEKLYDIMENVSLQPYISWQPDGLSFLIKDVQAVSEFVLPYYFKHNNIQSFVRQLNMYNFSKTRHDSNYREFRQPLFQRGRRDLLSDIKRKSQVSVEKSAALKRKYSANESENEARYSLAISHAEIPIQVKKCFWGGDEVCSREGECFSGNRSSANDGIEEGMER